MRSARQVLATSGNSTRLDSSSSPYGIRPYPYVELLPPQVVAPADTPLLIKPYSRNLTFSCELACVVDRDIVNEPADGIGDSIRGYGVLVTITDSSLVDRLYLPAERDLAMARYMRRWEESTFYLAGLNSQAPPQLYSSKTRIQLGPHSLGEGDTSIFAHRAPELLAFLSHLAPIRAGALVSLGSTGASVEVGVEDRIPDGTNVVAHIAGLPDLKVLVCDARDTQSWHEFQRLF